MKTNENKAEIGNLDSSLSIRAVSGGERGNKEAGKKYDYTVTKAVFLKLIEEVFDKEAERSNPENAKSGGAISQFLHSYGATADKMEKSGIDPFPAEKQEFGFDNLENWLEVMEFKAPRTGGNRKSAKDIQMEAALATLALPGITWAMIGPAYKGITEADLEAYQAKLAVKESEEA